MAAPAFNTADNVLNIAGDDIDLKMDKAPEEIKERFEHFSRLHSIATADNDAAFAESQSLQEDLRREEFALYHYERDCGRMGTGGDPKILGDHRDKIRILKTKLHKTNPKRGYLGGRKVMEFVSRIRASSFVVADIPTLPGPATLKMLSSATAAVDGAFKTQNRAETALRTLPYGLDALKSQVVTIKAAVPNVRPLFQAEDFDGKGGFEISDRPGLIEWPRVPLGFQVDSNIVYGVDYLGLLFWLFGDQIESKLVEMAKAVAPKHGMEIAEKAAAVAAAHVKVVDALRLENEILIGLEKAATYKRTRSIHPAVALGIEWNKQKIAEFVD